MNSDHSCEVGGDPEAQVPAANPLSSPEHEGGGGASSNEEDDVVETLKKPSSDQDELIPIPPPVPKSGMSILTHKLWIGNLDKRLTEQNVLRFAMKYGSIVSFRYLFKTGPERPEPRDYVFVEYSTREEAEKAKSALHGKRALGKRIIVDWARQDLGAAKKNSVSETWDASSVSETLDKTASTSSKIAALEAKLKQMEEGAGNGGPFTKGKRISTSLKIQQASRSRTSTGPKRLGFRGGHGRRLPIRH